MTKTEVHERIVEIGIVPVVRARSAEQAAQAAQAVCSGGIPVVEITMTVPGAIELMSSLTKKMGSEILIGAGTVLDAEMAQRCLDAGAQFLVSPGFDASTVQLANRSGVLIMAGALTPTEVITAWKEGADIVKIFPCGNVGGPKYIKALKGPLPQVPMVPTGGVNLQTAADFIAAGAEALGVGGELVSLSALDSGNLDWITETARQFLSLVRQARAVSAASGSAR
jgi:2-dehydro-3-deoxyphosphogluconate aldolase / (4S)-4-hydroxy-2-oxoglutarate aldolase